MCSLVNEIVGWFPGPAQGRETSEVGRGIVKLAMKTDLYGMELLRRLELLRQVVAAQGALAFFLPIA